MAAQPHAAHHIYLKKAEPIVVSNLLERLRLVDSQVVDQNVELRKALDHAASSVGGPEIGGNPLHFASRSGVMHLLYRFIHSLVASSIDYDRRAFVG